MSIITKLFIALGGFGIVFGFVTKGVPQLIAWALPEVVALVHGLMVWLLSKPSIKASAVRYRPQIEDLMSQIEVGLKRIFDAALVEATADLDAAAVNAKVTHATTA